MKLKPSANLWCILFTFLCLSPQINAENKIALKLEDLKPLRTGDTAPAFTVYRVDGSAFEYEPDKLKSPTLIIFYRGGWCGACNEQLQDLAQVIPEIRAMGVDVIFPNGDRPEILYSSLKPETKSAIEGLDYTLLSDSGLNAARAFGVAYVLDEETLNRYRSREEWDLQQSSMEKFDALPLPSIFMVNTDGKIAFAYYNFDPSIRLPAGDLADIVKKIVSDK